MNKTFFAYLTALACSATQAGHLVFADLKLRAYVVIPTGHSQPVMCIVCSCKSNYLENAKCCWHASLVACLVQSGDFIRMHTLNFCSEFIGQHNYDKCCSSWNMW